MSYNMEREFAK